MTKDFNGDHHFARDAAQLEKLGQMISPRQVVKPLNPSDPNAKLEEVGKAFLEWADGKKVEWRAQLDEALGLVGEHGRGVYGEMISESYSDFNTAFSCRVMPVYDKAYIDFWPTVDRWLFDNVYKKGAEMEMLALFQHRGPEKVLQVLHNLAPASSPKI